MKTLLEFSFIPALSSIEIELSFKIVMRTRVASSSKAFSINSLITSEGETQVLVANSLKKDGCTFRAIVMITMFSFLTFIYYSFANFKFPRLLLYCTIDFRLRIKDNGRH